MSPEGDLARGRFFAITPSLPRMAVEVVTVIISKDLSALCVGVTTLKGGKDAYC